MDKYGFPSWKLGEPRLVSKQNLTENVEFLRRLNNMKGSTRKIVGYENVRFTPDYVAGKTKDELQEMKTAVQGRLDEASKVVDDRADVKPTQFGQLEQSDAQIDMVADLLLRVEDGTRDARSAYKAAQKRRAEQAPGRTDGMPDPLRVMNEKTGRPYNAPNEERFAGPMAEWSPEALKEYDEFNELALLHYENAAPSKKVQYTTTQAMTQKQRSDWDAYPASWRSKDPRFQPTVESSAYEWMPAAQPNPSSGPTPEGLAAWAPASVDVDDVLGRMSEARSAGIDELFQVRDLQKAYGDHKTISDRLLDDLGLTPELLSEVSPGTWGQKGTFGNVLLYDSGYAKRGRASWKKNSIASTAWELQSLLAKEFGDDFDKFLAAYPNSSATRFVGSAAEGGVSWMEAAEALGGKAKLFQKGKGNMQKHVSPELQAQATRAGVRAAIGRLPEDARAKLWEAARVHASDRVFEAKTTIREAQSQLSQIDVALRGHKSTKMRVDSAKNRTVESGDRFMREYESLVAEKEAAEFAEIENLYELEAKYSRLSDDFDRLAAVDGALGAREAEEVAASDAVRSALKADWDVADQHVEYATERVETLKKWRDGSNGSIGSRALSKLVWDEAKSPYTIEVLNKRLDEFDHLLKVTLAELDPDPSLIAATRLYDEYFGALSRAAEFDQQTSRLTVAHEAELDALGLKRAFLDGWEALDHKLFPTTRDLAVDSVLKRHLENFMSAVNDDMDLKWFDEATQIFKSYATMTPGFHLRNFMGATFMNFSDGVTVGDTRLGMKHWRAYVDDPAGYVKSLPEDQDHVGRAFQAVFGVGAGGSFSASETGSGARQVWKGLGNNKAVRMSRRQGEDLVEGPVRLAAALNTTKRGGSVSDAMARVKRLHFDYSDLSGFDQKMKRVVPFWMFMSRNLPLQVEQMWRKPKAYAVYNHFMNNFDESDENSLMPKYLKDAGAIVMGGSWFGDDTKDFVFAPDLQHNNLMQDIMAFSGQGEQGIPIVDGLLASGNPIVSKPLEIAFNHSGFRGGEAFFDKKQDRYGNWVDKSAQEKALERLMYGVEGVFTPTGTAKGLLGIDPLGSEESQARSSDRRLQKALNYAGLPFKQLGDYERDYERRRQGREGE